MHRHLTRLLVALLLISMLIISLALPLQAQGVFSTNTPDGSTMEQSTATSSEGGIPFVTNTPEGVPFNTPIPFATNTPVGGIQPTPTVTPIGPTSALFNYSLKMWLEVDLIDLAREQIANLSPDDEEELIAAQLTLYEMERRVAGAPRNMQQRERFIETMLAAPRGVVDMRGMVRPFIIDALNQNMTMPEFEAGGFMVTVTSANLDSRDPADAVLHISYHDEDDTLLYDDYLLVLGTDDGGYVMPPADYDLYAVPFNGVTSITLDRIADINRDSLEEVVLQVSDSGINHRLVILAQRNGRIVELTQLGEEIRFSEIVSWNTSDPAERNPRLTVISLQAEGTAPDWECLSEIEYFWEYDRNLYRRSADLNARFTTQDSLACSLAAAEPLFAMTPTDAIHEIENALLEYGFDAPNSSRALMTLAMLYALEGRFDDARNTAQAVIPAELPDSWEAQQANALIEALSISSNTALDICEAVAAASPYPACDMDSVVGRYLGFVDLSTGTNLEDQLTDVGLPVRESLRVTEVGKADRIAVDFDLAGTGWWGFVEQRDGTYRAEMMENAPVGYTDPVMPVARISVPQAALDAFVVADDPSGVLEILTNLANENPNLPFTARGLYFRALANDLNGAREAARVTYYEVWERYPDTVWGRLAGRHLELR